MCYVERYVYIVCYCVPLDSHQCRKLTVTENGVMNRVLIHIPAIDSEVVASKIFVHMNNADTAQPFLL